ncbi:MAG: 4'-phosphopantetheinyl transferase superfamily protein [Roseobacter sp.]|jgi:4'-phosphopantetheinyl transferase EntD|nr:4'-phosphopantetheinyl transferase superfamily protein [Roseobacter sp.]
MTAFTALEQALRRSLGTGIGVSAADPRRPVPALFEAEKAATTRMRAKRCQEFAAGRATARAAMVDLGVPPAAIPMRPDRAPLWPTGLCGSIAHCERAVIAVVADRRKLSGIGIDIEEDTDLPADLWAEVMTPDETVWLGQQPPAEQGRRAKEVFCAKEAFHKLHHPLTGRMLGFDEVSLTWENQTFRVQPPIKTAMLPKTVIGHVLRAGGCVLAVMTVPGPVRAGKHNAGINA